MFLLCSPLHLKWFDFILDRTRKAWNNVQQQFSNDFNEVCLLFLSFSFIPISRRFLLLRFAVRFLFFASIYFQLAPNCIFSRFCCAATIAHRKIATSNKMKAFLIVYRSFCFSSWSVGLHWTNANNTKIPVHAISSKCSLSLFRSLFYFEQLRCALERLFCLCFENWILFDEIENHWQNANAIVAKIKGKRNCLLLKIPIEIERKQSWTFSPDSCPTIVEFSFFFFLFFE